MKFTKKFIIALLVALMVGGGVYAYVVHRANVTAFSGKIDTLLEKTVPTAAEPELVIIVNDKKVGNTVNLATNAVTFPILSETPEGGLVDQNGQPGQPLRCNFSVSAKNGALKNVGYQMVAGINDPDSRLLEALRVQIFDGVNEPIMIGLNSSSVSIEEYGATWRSDSVVFTTELKPNERYQFDVLVWFDEETLRSLGYNNESPEIEVAINFADEVAGTSGEF